MKTKEPKQKYPTLFVRISPEQQDFLRRESAAKYLTIPQYVRTVLFPFELSDGKK